MKKHFITYLNKLKREKRYREFLEIQKQAGRYPKAILKHKDKSKQVQVWSSTDNLSMGENPLVLTAMKTSLATHGACSGGSRYLTGTSNLHVALEREVSSLHGKDYGLLFNSGYVANLATISALAKILPDCIFFSDENNHASIIEAIKLSRAEKYIFKHNDPDHLKDLLKKSKSSSSKVIVFESLYSTEGDFGIIKEICELASHYNALLFIDEVHAVGSYGREGAGIANMLNLADKIDIVQGCFSKSYGVVGGYIATDEIIGDCIRCVASSFIFTTSLPPPIVAGSLASVQYLRKSNIERKKLMENVALTKKTLQERGLEPFMNKSHIISLKTGNAHKGKKMSRMLLEKYNIYLPALNFPTVPYGSERFRILPSIKHTEEDIHYLVDSLEKCYVRFR
ncbi:MAG: 5-aminolevulinate synthase [Alphaproteobacteria bacterium]|nr:5-aminolevulinate synthase [Alphaproteobacteria bacterium]